MVDYTPFTSDPVLNYLIGCNMALSGFILFKLFRVEKNISGKVGQIVTYLKTKFDDAKQILN